MEDVSSQRPRRLEEATEIHLSDTGKLEGETAPQNPPFGWKDSELPVLCSLCLCCSPPQGLVCEEAPWMRSRLQGTVASMTPADQQENQRRQCLTTSVAQMRLHPRPKVPSWEAVGVGVSLGGGRAVGKRRHPG